MTAPLQVYFIRHGETAWSISGQHTGRTDLPLTSHGEAMARSLATTLRGIDFSLVLTSPRLRARATCSLAGLGIFGSRVAQIDPDLAEWDYGDYEGLRTAEIRQRHLDWDVWRDGCPGGEMPADASDRADHLIARLCKLSGPVALFSHGQFGRVLAARWIGLPVTQGKHFTIDPATVGILGFEPDHPRRRVIALWNARAHRPAPGTSLSISTTHQGPTMTETATALPRLNEAAPDFKAHTTHGDRSLSDYKDKWLILFSHPADFTPVCTSEFIGFAKAADTFKGMNCELLGLSIDGLSSHLAWTRNIEEKFGVKVPFPIIEDIKMDVARAYGMVHPGASDTQAVRAAFFIDPKSILRAMVYYPMSNGRSIKEFLRLLEAMQTSDKNGVATPEGWMPGDDVLVPPPKTADAADKRAAEGYKTTDWYYSTTSL